MRESLFVCELSCKTKRFFFFNERIRNSQSGFNFSESRAGLVKTLAVGTKKRLH